MTEQQTLTLADFLLTRIGEDEAISLTVTARRPRDHFDYAKPDHWDWRDTPHNAEVTGPRGGGATAMYPSTARHIARWDPARVMAECEAKRRIVDLHQEGADEDWHGEAMGAGVCKDCDDDYPCTTLKLLALPYADHEQYRDEWRP